MVTGTLQAPVLIEGVRLRLRRSTPADAEAAFAAAANPEVMRYMDWPAHRAVADARTYLEGCAARWAAGSEYHWMVERKPGGEAIGSVACRVKGHAADFGCLLAHTHWGQGLGSEAAALVLGWLQRQPGLLRVWATCDRENTRSAALLRKIGLQQEGLMRRATVRPHIGGPPRDTLLFAWVREETAP